MKKAIILLVLMIQVAYMAAQESQTEYNFLRLPMSAHVGALGGDNISLIDDDLSLIYHNPALLTSVNDKTLSLQYMNYSQGANFMGVVFNKIIKERASAAVSAQYIGYGDMKHTSTEGQILGNFSAKDMALAGYFSYMLTEKLVGGVTAKFITSYIGSYSSVAMGIDLGLNYYDSEREWSISAVAKNLGGQLKAFDEEYERMPIDLQLGVSKHLTHTPFRFSATLINLNNWQEKFINHVVTGIEVLLSEQIWVGMGYHFRRANEMNIISSDTESNHAAGLSLGAGLHLQRFKLDLAYGKYHISNNAFMINAAFQW